MTSSQTVGFILGLRSRKLARARLFSSAPAGHAILLLPEVVVGQEQSTEQEIVRRYLDQGHYVTVVFARFRPGMTEYDHPLAHPRLEQHLRSEFNSAHWLAQYGANILAARQTVEVEDMCQDAFSRELAQSFEHLFSEQALVAHQQ